MRYSCYVLQGTDPLEHLAVEAALCEATPPPEAGFQPLALFYVNSASVVIGRNQNPWREAAEDAAAPVLRRTSGGGAVYHGPGNLNWALITPRADHDQDAELAMIARGVSSLGLGVEPGARGGIYVSDGPAAGRKVSGTARRFGRCLVLHHGTLLVDADLEALRSSLGGIATADDRSVASVPASPANVSDLAPGVGIEDAIRALSSACGGAAAASALGSLPDPLPAGIFGTDGARAMRLRLSSPDWVYGETPPFAFSAVGSLGEARLSVRSGLVEDASWRGFDGPIRSGVAESPSGSSDRAPGAGLAALVGERFSYKLARQARLLADGGVLLYH